MSLVTLASLALMASPPVTICIDPGHPSDAGSGTRGKHSTEIGVAWQVATALEAELKAEGFRVVLTKHAEPEMVTNRRRAEIANEARAALMVRLHCDAGEGSGFAVYYPDRKGTWKGNTGPDATVLQSSALAGKRFHLAMAETLAGSVLKDNGLKTDMQTAIGARQGALTGSIFSQVPVVLVEMVVLTNPKDEDFILSEAGKTLVVKALARGVLAATK